MTCRLPSCAHSLCFGNRSGVVAIEATRCAGGHDPHVAIGTNSVATLSSLVADLAAVSPVRQLENVPSPSWIGEANGVQLCVYVAQTEDEF